MCWIVFWIVVLFQLVFVFFFFKQKTAYDMRISDWSSDVCSSDLDEAEIVTLAVHPRQQRLGVARALLQQGLAAAGGRGAAACFLEVAEDNRPARALYAALGFAEIGRRRDSYDGKQENGAGHVNRRDAILKIRRATCRERVGT